APRLPLCPSTTRFRSGLAARASLTVTPEAVTIDGIDVTKAIRTPEIDRAATAVARLPKVRAVLVERQRAIGAGGGIVMEGRDIRSEEHTSELQSHLNL